MDCLGIVCVFRKVREQARETVDRQIDRWVCGVGWDGLGWYGEQGGWVWEGEGGGGRGRGEERKGEKDERVIAIHKQHVRTRGRERT